MPKLLAYLSVVFIFFHLHAAAQSAVPAEAAKNVVHGSVGTFVVVSAVHLSYDRLLADQQNGFFKSYYFTLRGGGQTAIALFDTEGDTGTTISAGFTGLTGKGKHHFEVGLGLGYLLQTTLDDAPEAENALFPSIALGYRK